MGKGTNTTRGRGNRGSRGHGRDRSKKQLADIGQLKKFAKRTTQKFIAVPDPDAAELAAFPSNFGALRRDETDNMGYRIPKVVPGEPVDARGRKKKKKKRAGAKRKIKMPYREIRPGEPDIDAGVAGWVQPKDTADFLKLGNRMDSLLETFDRVTWVGGIPYVRSFHAESTKLVDVGGGIVAQIKAKADSVTIRDTIGVSPGLSRALELMVNAGRIEEVRAAIESILEPLGKKYETMFRGPRASAKVTSAVPHIQEKDGHFHVDLWVHSTYLAEAEHGCERLPIPVRFWDAKALCHHGPGPGIVFWKRHLDVLGDLDELAKTEPEAAERAKFTELVCTQAMESCRKRAREEHEKQLSREEEAKGEVSNNWIRPSDDFARDVRIHQEIDELLANALPSEFVEKGRQEYRHHLIEAYKAGTTGVKLKTPEDTEKVKKIAKRALTRAKNYRAAAASELKVFSEVAADVMKAKAEADIIRTESERLHNDATADAAAAKQALHEAELDRRAAAAAKEVAKAEADIIRTESERLRNDATAATAAAKLALHAAEFDRQAAAATKEVAEAEAERKAATILGKANQKLSAVISRETRVSQREAALPAKEAAAEASGLRLAIESLFERDAIGRGVEKLREEIVSGIDTFRKSVEEKIWKKVFQSVAKRLPRKKAAKEVALELEEVLEGEKRGFVKRVFEALGGVNREPTIDNIPAVVSDFQNRTRIEALRDSLGEIRGGKTDEYENLDEEALRAQIRSDVGKFQSGVLAQTKVALVGLSRYLFGKGAASSVIESKENEEEMKSALKDEYDLRAALMKKALPLIESQEPAFAEEVRKVIGTWPEVTTQVIVPQDPQKSTKGDEPKIE
jgi:hypothetical protein